MALTADQIEQYKANWLNAAQSAVQQPTAQLQETQAAAGAAGASAQAATQQAANAALEQQQIQQKNNQQNFMKTAQLTLDAAAKKNRGYAPPQVYNQLKSQAAGLQIGDGTFDGAFEQNYTDPNKIDYNTSTGRENQSAYGEVQRQIQAQLSSFNAVPQDQKGVLSKSLAEGIPGIGQMIAPQAYAYESNKQGLAATLKSVAGAGSGSGVRVTQTELNNWSSLLPSVRNTDAVNASNLQRLDGLIKAKFNTPIGLNPTYLPGGQQNPDKAASLTGNGVLDKIISGAGNDITSDVKGVVGTGTDIVKQIVSGKPRSAVLGDAAINAGKGLVNQYGALVGIQGNDGKPILDPNKSVFQGGVNQSGLTENPSSIVSNAVNHPVNTALSLMPFLGAGKAAIAGDAGKGAAVADSAPLVKMPGKLQQIFKPQATKDAGSQIRDLAINQAQKEGASVTGDNIANGMDQWRKLALQANPGEANAAKINDIADGAIKQFGGQKVSPQDAVKIYNEIDSGFSRTGIQKETIPASGDMALRQLFSNELEKAAPGWKLGTSLIRNGFKADKGAGAKIANNLPQNAVKAGLNVAGLGFLRELTGL